MDPEKLLIREDFIRLDSALKLASIASTGGQAKIMIQDGTVCVNGEVCLMRGKKLRNGDRVDCDGRSLVIGHAN